MACPTVVNREQAQRFFGRDKLRGRGGWGVPTLASVALLLGCVLRVAYALLATVVQIYVS